jgi:hypothetical protein
VRIPEVGFTLVMAGGGKGGPFKTIWMAPYLALSIDPLMNWIVMGLPDVVVKNVLSIAMYWPPAAAKMSNAESTVTPLIETLKMRAPAEFQYFSANLSVMV